MSKFIKTIYFAILILVLISSSASAQLSYTIQNIDDDIPGLTQLEDTSFYKFESGGKEYYTSKSATSLIMNYNQDAFDFFVRGLKDSTYVWTGEYYMLRQSELTYWQAYNELYKFSQAGNAKILFYDENFNLVHEQFFPSVYISDIGYRNGQYYCTVLDGTSYISTDIENWEQGELDNSDEVIIYNNIRMKGDYSWNEEKSEYDFYQYMSLDECKYYKIFFERDCRSRKATSDDYRTSVTRYIIREQSNNADKHSWLGISNNNIYYTYIDMNLFKSAIGTEKKVHAGKVFEIDDYLYIMLTTYSIDVDNIIVKIPLSEIDAELDAMKDAPIVVYDNTILGFEQAPVIDEGRTLIPIRFLFEKMGATVDWNGDTQTATITQNNTAVAFSIDDTEADVNGQTVSMDVPAKLINGKTMVPVRFLSENLGYTVDWDADKKIITIE